jgi:hypothetical protein
LGESVLEVGVEAGEAFEPAGHGAFPVVCVLEKGLVFGSSLFYATTTGGQPLVPEAAPIPQERIAVETTSSLFIFYSRLMDYILGRGDSALRISSAVYGPCG